MKLTPVPKMMTIKEVAKTGILPENALRTLNKQGRLPAVQVGNTTYINYTLLIAMLNHLKSVG